MSQAQVQSQQASVVRIPPHHYLHVLDQNLNVTRVETGPKTFIRQDHEKVLVGPSKMIVVPPRHYCTIENPIILNDKNEPALDEHNQYRLRHADREVRLAQDPFPLYPGEVLVTSPQPLVTVKNNTALRLRALSDYESTDKDGKKVVRNAGDEWLFPGPATYIPEVHVEVVETIVATIIGPNQALRLRARQDCVSRHDNKKRVTGEEWHVTNMGAYLPGTYEEVIRLENAYVLTENIALHLRAIRTFVDQYGKERKTGEEWLATSKDSEIHVPNVSEEVVKVVDIITLSNRQFCVVANPVEDGVNRLGKKRLVKGERSFFLQPGESLVNGIQNVYVLGPEEALVLRALEEFEDETNEKAPVTRKPGDRWMITGPSEYFPPVEVEVIANRKAIPLDENEGIYVRDMKTGRVRAIVGETYMLKENEELWNKDLPQEVEDLLAVDALADRQAGNQRKSAKSRDKSAVVAYRVPHNACVQVYDYKKKKSRVEFGPDLVMLQPDEQFTLLNLSGGKPKRPNQIRALCLLLGPDFCTDVITIETADHARLSLQLSYNWHFNISRDASDEEKKKLFSVPDFIGDVCKAIASRVRGAVAGVGFDDFHRNSARIIRTAVFGLDENNKVRDSFSFPANNMVITSIDIQSVEPVDQRTRDALLKSVQLAIEITTNSQEAAAKHEAERIEQEARGKLERQKIKDEAEAEKARKQLLELQAQSAAVESTGQAKAEATARAESAQIEGMAAVRQAELKAQAVKIEAESELERLTHAREAEIKYIRDQNEMEISKSKEIAAIEIDKFKKMIEAIGPQTIVAMAQAGPEMQVKLLQSLGIKSTLITDGSNPINLFQTAQGLLGSATITEQK